MKTTRRTGAMLLSVLVTVLGMSWVAAPAQAADYFRFWTYFHVDGGTYVSYTEGVGSSKPADGSIEAYRFAASESFEKPNLPRVDLGEVTFDEICGSETAAAGQKRVAVILDYGVADDANGQEIPGAEADCAVVATDATGLQVLQAVAQVRTEDMGGPVVCAINGFPAQGCTEKVTTATPADDGFVQVAIGDEGPESTSADEGVSTLVYAGLGVLLLLLIGGGVFLARRKNSKS